MAPGFSARDRRGRTGYVFTGLFMSAPFSTFWGTLPAMGRAHIAAEKIKSLGLSLSDEPSEPSGSGGVSSFRDPQTEWSRVDLVDVLHVYRHDGAEGEFCLGPVNLTVAP